MRSKKEAILVELQGNTVGDLADAPFVREFEGSTDSRNRRAPIHSRNPANFCGSSTNGVDDGIYQSSPSGLRSDVPFFQGRASCADRKPYLKGSARNENRTAELPLQTSSIMAYGTKVHIVNAAQTTRLSRRFIGNLFRTLIPWKCMPVPIPALIHSSR